MKEAVLIINLGTPNSPETGDVRTYLTQFLNDRRVIDISAIGRFLLVNFIIVPFRSSKSANLYKQIWTKDGSPLLTHTRDLTAKLQKEMGDNYIVDFAMRYQNPGIKTVLNKLRKESPTKISIIPLYPQYASSSTGSTLELVMKEIAGWEVIPNVNLISNFFNDPGFISSIVEQGKQYNIADYDHILFSYHGLPERQIKKASDHYGSGTCSFGNCCDTLTKNNHFCYRANCFATTRELVKQLNIPEGKYTSTFQSRLDDKWLKPYSDKVIEDLGKKGMKKLLVFSPAFVADCLETIYEIGTEYNEIFKHNGGESVTLVKSLNSNDTWVKALKNLIH